MSKKPYQNKNNKRKAEKDLEYTMRIRVDSERLNDSDTLDTSFLEGRRQNKDHIISNEKNDKSSKFLLKILLIFLGIVCIFFLAFFVFQKFFPIKVVEEKKEKEKSLVEEKKIDDNYLFVGSFHTENMNMEDFSFPFVKESSSSMTTSDILENMREKIYQYNPSVVVLELGLEDLLQGKDEDEVLSQIERIIKSIQENRPYAKIYVESLYPIGSELENFDIDEKITSSYLSQFNEKLKDKTSSLQVEYIDLYSILVDNDSLKSDYTSNGVILNDEGYSLVWTELQRILEKH